jgi:hypothetical protein
MCGGRQIRSISIADRHMHNTLSVITRGAGSVGKDARYSRSGHRIGPPGPWTANGRPSRVGSSQLKRPSTACPQSLGKPLRALPQSSTASPPSPDHSLDYDQG